MTYPAEGTASDVIDWVGDDRARAIEAREAEIGRPSPRKTVLERIESVTARSGVTFKNADGVRRTVAPDRPVTIARYDSSRGWERA